MNTIEMIEVIEDIKRRRQRPDRPVYADHTLQADIDTLIIIVENFVGSPTAIERGEDVDAVLDRFIESNKGLFDGVDTQEYMDQVRER